MKVYQASVSLLWRTGSLFLFSGNPYNPVSSLAKFQEDNEIIENQDLVSWISLGVSHLPTTEDIPVTTTGMTYHVEYNHKFYLLAHLCVPV